MLHDKGAGLLPVGGGSAGYFERLLECLSCLERPIRVGRWKFVLRRQRRLCVMLSVNSIGGNLKMFC